MTLVVNLVRKVLSAKFICWCWRNPWCYFCVMHTLKCNEPAKIKQIINCGLTILIVFVFPLPLYEIRRSLDMAPLTNQNGRYFCKTHLATLYSMQWRSQPRNFGGGKMFDFRQITLFYLEKRLSKHKMTIVSKNLGAMALSPPWLHLWFNVSAKWK